MDIVISYDWSHTYTLIRRTNAISNKLKGPGGSLSYVVGSINSYKPITNTAWVRAQLCKLQKRCTLLTAANDKVYQLLAQGRWFSPGTPASSTTKTGRHDIAEILLKVAWNTKIKIQIQIRISCCHFRFFYPIFCIWLIFDLTLFLQRFILFMIY
jgi:hypothetical protein